MARCEQDAADQFALHTACSREGACIDGVLISVECGVNASGFKEDIGDALHERCGVAAEPCAAELLFHCWKLECCDGFHCGLFVHARVFCDSWKHGRVVGFIGPHCVCIGCDLEELGDKVAVLGDKTC